MADETVFYTVHSVSSGFALYHNTLNAFLADREEMPYASPHLFEAPPVVRYMTNLNKPMYFGMSEIFTRYYDSTFEYVHLQFETTKELKLINLGWGKDFDVFTDEFLIANGLDGWIAEDFPGTNWYEIYILNPADKVRFVREIDSLEYMVSDYPQGIDNARLEAETTIVSLLQFYKHQLKTNYGFSYNELEARVTRIRYYGSLPKAAGTA